MRHIRSVMWKFSRGLYVLSSIMLLVLLVLVLKDASGVMWRWPADAVRFATTALPYALLTGGGLSVLLLAGMTVGAIFQRN